MRKNPFGVVIIHLTTVGLHPDFTWGKFEIAHLHCGSLCSHVALKTLAIQSKTEGLIKCVLQCNRRGPVSKGNHWWNSDLKRLLSQCYHFEMIRWEAAANDSPKSHQIVLSNTASCNTRMIITRTLIMSSITKPLLRALFIEGSWKTAFF